MAQGMSEKAAILIVDDRPEKVLSLEVILEKLGQEIVRAYSGREALRYILQRDFAVILLDVNMPGMDGFETAALIRQRKSSENTPIIFVTAFGDEMHANRGYSLGAVDYILAPVVPDVLRSKVGVFVDLYLKNYQLRNQADSLRKRASQMQKLAAASVAINSAQSLEGIIRTITDTARDIIGAHQAITLFFGPHAGPARSQALAISSLSDRYAKWRDRPLPIERLADTLVAQSRRPTRMTESELHLHPDWEIVKSLDIPPVKGGMLVAPLHGREGDNWGLIYVADAEAGSFTSDDEMLLVQLSQMGSISIENTLNAHEREANRLKDQFLATLSHELRTPLNAMLGWTELLRGEMVRSPIANEEFVQGLQIIERNAMAQKRLIEDLLDVSRISTGNLRVVKSEMRIQDVVQAAIEAVRPAAVEKQVTMKCSMMPLEPIEGDPDRLQQVVWNLLVNAVKFTPAGGEVSISVSAIKEGISDSTGVVEIQVTDSGIGIEPQFLPQVFDRFRQADASTTRRHAGLGIGLTIVKHIVELHDGTVRANSLGRNRGSTFTVSLPLRHQAQSVHLQSGISTHQVPVSDAHLNHALPGLLPSAADFTPPDLSGVHILIVEDQDDTRALITELLHRAGASVVSASNVGEAVELLQQRPPGLVISDIAMPGEDGYTMLRRVRQFCEERNVLIPVIAVTAFAHEEDRKLISKAGFAGYLTKPLSVREFLHCVHRHATSISSMPPNTEAITDSNAIAASS